MATPIDAMASDQHIAIELFCRHEGVEITFVRSLHERGLIEVIAEGEHQFIAAEQLPRLEQLARLHYELEINLEGIEAITHMLQRVERLQSDLRALHDRLRLYEEGPPGQI